MADDDPTCRLYLTTPPELVSGGVAVTAFGDLLARVIAATDVACLRIAGDGSDRVTSIAKELLAPTQSAGIAVLLDHAELARKLGADGVHLDDLKQYGAMRKALGDEFSIGVACPLERHAAMEVAEAGADYVQFDFVTAQADEALDLIAWWSEMMTVPSVALCPPDPVIAAKAIEAGADFLAPDVGLWSQGDAIGLLRSLIP